MDLLLFHTQALAHVVVELKIGKFKPADAGQLGFYVAMVDDKLRNLAIHAPTVGILLCASRNEAAVRYALGNNTAPLAVANFTDVPELEKLHLPPARRACQQQRELAGSLRAAAKQISSDDPPAVRGDWRVLGGYAGVGGHHDGSSSRPSLFCNRCSGSSAVPM